MARRTIGKGARIAGPAQKLWYPVRDHLEPAYRVRVRRLKPREVWDVIVHAVSGAVLWKYDNLSIARARAEVFNPSPVAVLGDHQALLGPKRRPRRPPARTYEPVNLLGLDKSGFLRGAR